MHMYKLLRNNNACVISTGTNNQNLIYKILF